VARSDMTAVGAAFEMLLEEIEGVIEDVNHQGAVAFEHGKHADAEKVLDQAKTLTGLRQKLLSFRKEWDSLYSQQTEEVKEKVARKNLGKVKRGTRTREEAYYVPILRALSEMGGSGRIGDVLDRVHVLMKGILKPVDHEPLRSYPKTIRWRNAAQWARNSMVNEGLMVKGSPYGIWEISDQGREWLKKNGGNVGR